MKKIDLSTKFIDWFKGHTNICLRMNGRKRIKCLREKTKKWEKWEKMEETQQNEFTRRQEAIQRISAVLSEFFLQFPISATEQSFIPQIKFFCILETPLQCHSTIALFSVFSLLHMSDFLIEVRRLPHCYHKKTKYGEGWRYPNMYLCVQKGGSGVKISKYLHKYYLKWSLK